MKSYNTKCIGCGAYLNDDPHQIGYVEKYDPEKTHYCKRCFRLIHYGELDNKGLDLNQIQNQIQELDYDKSVYIFHVVDVLDLNDTVLRQFLDHQDKLCFIVNKMDCLPKQYNAQLTAEMITKTIESFGYKHPKILYCSANNKTAIKRLYGEIKKVCGHKLKPLFVGCSNVGKSTLINRLCEINDVKPRLTVSPFVNTTILIQKIKIDKLEILDTPGLPLPANLLNYVDHNVVKKLTNFKNLRPKNFSVSVNQAFVLEGLGLISYVDGNPDKKVSFTYYLANELQIKRCKLENGLKNLEIALDQADIKYNLDHIEWVDHELELDENRKHNLNICGLGLITLGKGIKKIKVRVPNQVGVSVCEYAII